MSKSTAWCLAWNAELAHYQLTGQTKQGMVVSELDIEGDAWHEWLDQVSSFAFQSKDGSHCTALKERRGRSGAYWTAYRKVGGKLKRKYLGLSKEVSLTALEQAATALMQLEIPAASPPPLLTPWTPSSAGNPMVLVAEQLQEQLLATKFLPSAPSHTLISRPRLYTLLNEGIERPLTLVSAPAGFGKTSLLEGWVQSLPAGNLQVVWVSLDEADNDIARFWRYVLIALDRREPGLSQRALTLLQAPPRLEHMLTALIDALARTTKRFVLVLDDYHLISEITIHASLDYLLEHQPPQLRLILLSRSEPPLKVFQRHAHGQLLEIRSDDLRCNMKEAMQFLGGVMGIQLSNDLLEQAVARTEGWLTGLQLLGLYLREHANPDQLRDTLAGSERYILEYLIEEVLQRQSAAIQEFLLYTSILDHLSGPLCDAVRAQTNSQDVLEGLERANVFVHALDQQRRLFRYHTLFAEALRYQLERTHAPMVCTLHRRASQWYAEHNQRREAVHHALLAHDWQLAADLMETLTEAGLWQHWEVWEQYEGVGMMLEWLRQLPEEAVRTRPRLALYYASILFIAGYPRETEPWLEAAQVGVATAHSLSSLSHEESHDAASPSSVTSPRGRERECLLGEVAAWRAVVAAYYGESEHAYDQYQLALSYLSEQDLFQQSLVAEAQGLTAFSQGQVLGATEHLLRAGTLRRASATAGAAITYLSLAAHFHHVQGRLHEASQLLQQTARLGISPEGHPFPIVGVAYAYQADVLREWNRLDAALDLALQGISFIEQTNYMLYIDTAYAVLARIYLSRGEVEAAGAALKQALNLATLVDNPYRRSWLTSVEQARLWLGRGEMERASYWAQQLAPGERASTPLAREQEDLARARVLLARHQADEALTLLEPLRERATATGRFDHAVKMRALEALAHSMRGEEEAALAALSEAVRLGEPEGYIRSFVDEGAPMARLLSRLREQRRRRGPTPYLTKVLAAFAQKGTGEKLLLRQGLQERLSERELEVLRELAQGASNQEISDRLVISADTVKRHVSNILAKLEASNRMQAVARARRLGLLQEE